MGALVFTFQSHMFLDAKLQSPQGRAEEMVSNFGGLRRVNDILPRYAERSRIRRVNMFGRAGDCDGVSTGSDKFVLEQQQ